MQRRHIQSSRPTIDSIATQTATGAMAATAQAQLGRQADKLATKMPGASLHVWTRKMSGLEAAADDSGGSDSNDTHCQHVDGAA